jgi:hypothetical protein
VKPISYEDYLARSGDDSLSQDGPIIQNEHGFMVWRVTATEFIIVQCYGDGDYWNSMATQMAQTMGLHRIVFTTKRNPKTYTRRFGYTVQGYILVKEI